MPDPVNNETGVLADGRTDAQTPFNSPAAGGTTQNTQLGSHRSPATSDGNAGASNRTPLHTDGGNAQETGTGPEVDTGNARIPGVNATGMPQWTEVLEAINAIPEKVVLANRESEFPQAAPSGPMPGAAEPQNPDAPNQTKAATGPSATVPGEDRKVHWWFRSWS